MTEIELLWFTLFDTFAANLAFITNQEISVWAAPALSDVSHKKILSAAFFGVLVANCVNYLLGIVCGNIFSSITKKNDKAQKNSGALKDLFSDLGIYLLCFGFLPVYSKLIVLLMGFCRYRFFSAITIVAIVKTIYYFYYGK